MVHLCRSLDAVLVSPGHPTALPVVRQKPDLTQGVSFCLANNLWGKHCQLGLLLEAGQQQRPHHESAGNLSWEDVSCKVAGTCNSWHGRVCLLLSYLLLTSTGPPCLNPVRHGP